MGWLVDSDHSLVADSDFLRTSATQTRSALRILNPGLPEAELERRFQDCLQDESVQDAEYLSNAQPILPDSESRVEDYVNLRLLTLDIDDMETSYLDTEGEPEDKPDVPPL